MAITPLNTTMFTDITQNFNIVGGANDLVISAMIVFITVFVITRKTREMMEISFPVAILVNTLIGWELNPVIMTFTGFLTVIGIISPEHIQQLWRAGVTFVSKRPTIMASRQYKQQLSKQKLQRALDVKVDTQAHKYATKLLSGKIVPKHIDFRKIMNSVKDKQDKITSLKMKDMHKMTQHTKVTAWLKAKAVDINTDIMSMKKRIRRLNHDVKSGLATQAELVEATDRLLYLKDKLKKLLGRDTR